MPYSSFPVFSDGDSACFSDSLQVYGMATFYIAYGSRQAVFFISLSFRIILLVVKITVCFCTYGKKSYFCKSLTINQYECKDRRVMAPAYRRGV